MSKPPEHVYTSNACIHDYHLECDIQCRYCKAICECDCHDPAPTAEPIPELEAAAELVPQ